jgi:hypothetical protein
MKIITLEGVALESLETPQGRKRASRIFRRNEDNVTVTCSETWKVGRGPEIRATAKSFSHS